MGARQRTGTSARQVSDAPGPVFKQALKDHEVVAVDDLAFVFLAQLAG
jgi:hypothetical protein